MSRTILGLVGTVTVTQYSATVTGSGTDWTSEMEGKYIRIGVGTKMYTINSVASTTSLSLTERYQEPSGSALQFQLGDGERFSRPQLIEEPEQAVETQEHRVGRFPNFDGN